MKVEAKPALTFGFAAWSRAQIREGLSKFAAALVRHFSARAVEVVRRLSDQMDRTKLAKWLWW
jgi:hypothetical protein